MPLPSIPTSKACVRSDLLHCKGTLAVDTKKKFQVFQVSVGSGRFWYYNPDSLQEPLDIISLLGCTCKVNSSKDKADSDKHQFQAVLEKEKSTKILISFDSSQDCSDWIATVNLLIDETSNALFGLSVPDAAYKTNQMVPSFVYYIVNLLRPEISTEGIFRLPGSQSHINDLKAKYSDGELPQLADCEVPTLASLLKVFFRELANPLIPANELPKYFDAVNGKDDSKVSSNLKELVKQLDDPSRITLTYIIKFFKEVSSKSAQNKMDAPNLAIATAPSLLKATGAKDELTAATLILKVIEKFISDYSNIFNPEDENRALDKPMGFLPNDGPGDRPEYTSAEKPLMNTVLTSHKEDPDHCYYARVMKIVPKTKALEDSILVVGSNRIYVFSHGGKLDFDIPLPDLQEIISPCTSTVTVVYNSAQVSKQQEFKFRPTSMVSFDSDVSILKIRCSWQQAFVGAPADTLKMGFTYAEDRLKSIMALVPTPNIASECGGFIRSYQMIADYYSVPALEDFIWDLENLFSNNMIKSFILSECVRKDKYPNDDMKCYMQCLYHNQWFTSINADNQKLGSESTLQLVNVFRTNRSIKQLQMSNVGAPSSVFAVLAENISFNTHSSLNWIDISQNSLEDKAVAQLSSAFEKIPSLVHLNLSGCGISKKAMPGLLDSMQKSPSICGGLSSLNLSNNSLDSVDASRQLGLLLGKCKSMRELNIAGASPNFLNILAAFEKSTIVNLNVSDTKISTKNQDDLTDFLKRSPFLTSLIMNNVNLTLPQLNDILSTHASLTMLDISDNDFSDEGVLSLCDFLLSKPEVTPQLCDLRMNRMFPKRSKDRPQAMLQLANLLEARPVSVLQLKGGPKSQLKIDLVPLVFGLINNQHLKNLDVAGNQCGDGLALAFAKFLQHNHVLQTLYWDDNATTMVGLRSFRIGLARNETIRKMPLPVLDMAAILKSETDLQAVVTLSSEIQEIVFDNALNATSGGSLTPSSSISSSSSGPDVSAPSNQIKKPIEPPRSRIQSSSAGGSVGPSTATSAGPAAKKPPNHPRMDSTGSGSNLAAAPKKINNFNAQAVPVVVAPAAFNNNSGGSSPLSPRGNISKANVYRASILYGASLPVEAPTPSDSEPSTPTGNSTSSANNGGKKAAR